MASFLQRLRNARFVLSLTIVLLLGVAVGIAIGTSDRVPESVAAQDGLPLVTSAAPAIRVVSLQRTTIGNSPVLNVSLQNVSSKNISAYSIGNGKAWITRNYFFAERTFLPNAIENQIVPLDTKGFSTGNREFTVTGVLFNDGSTDGQAIPVFRLKENWTGLRDHIRVLLPCLRSLPSALKSQHETLPSFCDSETAKRSSEGRSSDYQDGFQHAQREFLSQLDEIKNKVSAGDFFGAAKHKDKLIKSFESFQDQ